MVLVGDTVITSLLPRLFDQAYVPAPAPEAVNIVLVPLQMVAVLLMDATGEVRTVTVRLEVAVQPLAEVTVTVYIVVVVGETIRVAVAVEVLQRYVELPLAVSVTGLPEHIVPSLDTSDDSASVTTGVGYTQAAPGVVETPLDSGLITLLSMLHTQRVLTVCDGPVCAYTGSMLFHEPPLT